MVRLAISLIGLLQEQISDELHGVEIHVQCIALASDHTEAKSKTGNSTIGWKIWSLLFLCVVNTVLLLYNRKQMQRDFY